eukprot:4995210-Amphidinium_carterae.2
MEITIGRQTATLSSVEGASQIYAVRCGGVMVGILVAYVDDLLCLLPEVVRATFAVIHSRWPCKDQGIIEAPGSIQFLGVRLSCDADGVFWIDQQKWFKAVVEDRG